MRQNPVFEFHGYRIGNMQFDMNYAFDGEEPDGWQVPLRMEQAVSVEGEGAFYVALRCKLFDGFSVPEEKVPFRLRIEMIGSFMYSGPEDQQAIGDFAKINAPAILFPYLRAAISQIVSLAGFSQVVLPLMSFLPEDEESDSEKTERLEL